MVAKEDIVEHQFGKKSAQEQHDISQKGGIKSGEVRRQKATMRAVLEDMLKEIPKKGNPEGLSYQQMATLGLIKGAVKGNAQNYKTMVETLGEINASDDNKSNGVIVDLIEALSNAKRDK